MCLCELCLNISMSFDITVLIRVVSEDKVPNEQGWGEIYESEFLEKFNRWGRGQIKGRGEGQNF